MTCSRTPVPGSLFNKVVSLTGWKFLTVLERDSTTAISLRILWNFSENFFCRTPRSNHPENISTSVQHEINVETTLGISTLQFTTFNKVPTTLCISMLNLATLDKVETTLSFSTSIFAKLGKVKITLQIWPFAKKIKPQFINKIIFLNFKEYVGLKIFFILPHFRRNF